MTKLIPNQKASRLALIISILGLILYNWWIFVFFRPGLIKSPNELFSNLEITGQPFAWAMQRTDILSGILLIIALAMIYRKANRLDFKEWAAVLLFGVFGSIGGIFSESCADEISASCRAAEWGFRLPLHHYIHMLAGVAEFAAITYSLYLAHTRTKNQVNRPGKVYKFLWRSAFYAYPLLGIAYIFDIYGAIMEIVFFIGFTILIVEHFIEWTKKSPGPT